MTFKHTKFEESPTMRSLEKLAHEKGLIKNDPLKKIADRKPITKKANLEPTGNLTENILRLCEGLKEIGLSKYAEELESTYISYKKAENFHKTSKDKGEDLVDEAHPKGSHKLEGVDGDATIETIIDQQAEDIKIINKKPTGKLSSLEIINAVKISLADDGKVQVLDTNAQINGRQKMLLSLEKLDSALIKIQKHPKALDVIGGAVKDRRDEIYIILENLKKNNPIYESDLNKFNQLVFKIRLIRDRLVYKQKLIELDDSEAFEYQNIIETIDYGISLSYAANQLLRAQSSGEYHVLSKEISELIKGIEQSLLKPILDLRVKIRDFNVNNVPDEHKTNATNIAGRGGLYDQVLSSINTAIDKIKNVPGLRIVNMNHLVIDNIPIGNYFGGALSGRFNDAYNWSQFQEKAKVVVDKMTRNVNWVAQISSK